MSDDEKDVVVSNREGANPYGLSASTLSGYASIIKQFALAFVPLPVGGQSRKKKLFAKTIQLPESGGKTKKCGMEP